MREFWTDALIARLAAAVANEAIRQSLFREQIATGRVSEFAAQEQEPSRGC
jgi:hypothetical protein